jgi:exonuclease SbcD
MKILHTADWHIGQTLTGYGREHEHRAVLDELVAIVGEREVDALVVAGDVFDHQNPSGEAQRLFYETLIALKRVRPVLTVVVTAGNHDAAGRLEAPRALLDSMDVHIVGNVRRVDGRIDAARHLVPLRSRGGEIAAHVLAVSYPTAACLPPFSRLDLAEGHSPIVAATADLYSELHERSGAGRTGLPFMVTGHLHVAGGLESEGAERRILVGGAHAVPHTVFPEAATYVALGHLHRAQRVGIDTVRYSGSLLPLSASELSYAHSVTLVTLTGGAPAIEQIALRRPVPFLRLPESGEIRLDELEDRLAALELPHDLPIEWRPFVQVRLARAGLKAGFRAEVDQIAERFPVRIVEARAGDAGKAELEAARAPATVRLGEIDPEDLFRQAFARTHHGAEPAPAHLDAFHQAAAAAAAEA